MAGGNGDAAAQRAEARARRRAEQARRQHAAEGDESRGEGEDSEETHHGRALEAARSAAAAAAVGAAVGAARAFMTRHDQQQGDEETREDEPVFDGEQEEPAEAAAGEPSAGEEPHGQADEREDEERVTEAEPGEERRPVARRRDRRREGDVQSAPPRGGVASDRIRSIVARAREHLRDLQGSDAESVSSLERRNGGWVVTLEVVEVRRVPESTDVLASYAVELDDQGDLVAYERLRRYYRAQGAVGDER